MPGPQRGSDARRAARLPGAADPVHVLRPAAAGTERARARATAGDRAGEPADDQRGGAGRADDRGRAPARAQLAVRWGLPAGTAARGGPDHHLRRGAGDRGATSSRAASATASGRPCGATRWPRSCFADRSGYCQQFSGAMALLLRMDGIPARVAAGFAPGTLRPRPRRVARARPGRALLGGGLVPGIGWVPFDPTPGGGPGHLAGQPRRAPPSAALGGTLRHRRRRRRAGSADLAGLGGGSGASGAGAGAWLVAVVGALALAALSPALARLVLLARRRRRLAGHDDAALRGAAGRPRAPRLPAAGARPRCSSSSAGCAWPPGPAPRTTSSSLRAGATGRRARAAPARATGARCGGRSPAAGARWRGCAACVALPPHPGRRAALDPFKPWPRTVFGR